MTIGALSQSSGGNSRVKISLAESVVGKSFRIGVDVADLRRALNLPAG
jgi:hypothetical protein